MGIRQFFEDVRTGISVGLEHVQFRDFLERDRQATCDELTSLVQRLAPEQLDQFERTFLTHSIAVVEPTHRLRAMELYAFLKMQETMHYNAFRGFIGDGGPLTT